jgi:RNase P/RNase MRP subunit POP5
MRLKRSSSQKERSRYIVFNVHSSGQLDFVNVKNAIWDSLCEWLGANDMAKANIWIMKTLWSHKEQSGFIKCSRNYVDKIKVGLALVHQIGDTRVVFQATRVAGTIKSGKASVKKRGEKG